MAQAKKTYHADEATEETQAVDLAAEQFAQILLDTLLERSTKKKPRTTPRQ